MSGRLRLAFTPAARGASLVPVRRLADPDPDTARTAALAAVGIAAGLLLLIAFYGLRISKHSSDIKESLEGIRDKTAVLWDIPDMNFAIEDITSTLRDMRKGAKT